MSKKAKLIKRIKTKPRDFTFDEAETLILSLGGKKSSKGKTSGSKEEDGLLFGKLAVIKDLVSYDAENIHGCTPVKWLAKTIILSMVAPVI